MKNYSAMVCASVLALALSACGGGEAPTEEEQSTGVSPETGVVIDSVSDSNEAGEARLTPAVPFDEPNMVTSPIVRSLPSLTPSASTTDRLNSTSSGKADPFAGRVISVRPIPPDPQDIPASFPLAQQPGRSIASTLGRELAGGADRSGAGTARSGRTSGGSNPVAVRNSDGSNSASTPSPSGTTGTRATSGGSPASSNGSSGSASATGPSSGNSGSDSAVLPDLDARPPIPDPTLARAVEVSGVVLIGSNYQAIVKAPDEPTSRYVTAGQRLSGGRVLVKRIENQGSEPVVILEEDGVEVVRSVGAPAEGPAGDATALLPELSPAS